MARPINAKASGQLSKPNLRQPRSSAVITQTASDPNDQFVGKQSSAIGGTLYLESSATNVRIGGSVVLTATLSPASPSRRVQGVQVFLRVVDGGVGGVQGDSALVSSTGPNGVARFYFRVGQTLAVGSTLTFMVHLSTQGRSSYPLSIEQTEISRLLIKSNRIVVQIVAVSAPDSVPANLESNKEIPMQSVAQNAVRTSFDSTVATQRVEHTAPKQGSGSGGVDDYYSQAGYLNPSSESPHQQIDLAFRNIQGMSIVTAQMLCSWGKDLIDLTHYSSAGDNSSTETGALSDELSSLIPSGPARYVVNTFRSLIGAISPAVEKVEQAVSAHTAFMEESMKHNAITASALTQDYSRGNEVHKVNGISQINCGQYRCETSIASFSTASLEMCGQQYHSNFCFQHAVGDVYQASYATHWLRTTTLKSTVGSVLAEHYTEAARRRAGIIEAVAHDHTIYGDTLWIQAGQNDPRPLTLTPSISTLNMGRMVIQAQRDLSLVAKLGVVMVGAGVATAISSPVVLIGSYVLNGLIALGGRTFDPIKPLPAIPTKTRNTPTGKTKIGDKTPEPPITPSQTTPGIFHTRPSRY